ncbi:MAG: hypothetical protein HMLIMOIP_002526, partial [Candidatus Nitrosomirales archaeon]
RVTASTHQFLWLSKMHKMPSVTAVTKVLIGITIAVYIVMLVL